MPDKPNHEERLSKTPGSPSHARRASMKVLSRNIDKVVLGNLQFDSWYFSPYPETVIYGPDYHIARLNGDHRNGQHVEKSPPPVVPKLHVCPYCFKYTTSPVDYIAHVHTHTVHVGDDGEPRDPVPESALKVYEWNGYTVWDVDGEQEKLYCQNLSLFAKLFLEQKSVFFDTSGFHYFVLTYTPPQDADSPSGQQRGRRRLSIAKPTPELKSQVMGFFSKENLSWDSNNLACILVFPPFQHRNLGQLLMAVSYKLSGWEWEDSIIGGPEKPLSSLGKKSYLRFWSERVARFMMGQTTDAESHTVFSGEIAKKRNTFATEHLTIKEIGDKTGMLPEDVIAALKEMGICKPTPQTRKQKTEEQPQTDEEAEVPATMVIKRSEVLAWARRKNVDLVGPIHEEGFLGEWAMSDSADERVSGSDEEAASDSATS